MEQLEVAIASFKGIRDGAPVDAKAILAAQCREGLALLLSAGYKGKIWLGTGNFISLVGESMPGQYASRYVLEGGQLNGYFRTGKSAFFGQLVKLEPKPLVPDEIPFEEYPLDFLNQVAANLAKGLGDIIPPYSFSPVDSR